MPINPHPQRCETCEFRNEDGSMPGCPYDTEDAYYRLKEYPSCYECGNCKKIDRYGTPVMQCDLIKWRVDAFDFGDKVIPKIGCMSWVKR